MGQPQAPIWNIPYERNPLFTGREDVLKKLSEALKSGKSAAIGQTQAISGLGGIGKTQTAVEYAYRNRDNYNTILWVKAETEASISADFVTLAIYEKMFPPDHPCIANVLESYARLLREANRIGEAEPLEKRARAIKAKRSI